MSEQDLLQVAHEACAAARRAGAEFVEVSISEGRSTSVRVERSQIDTTEARVLSGASVRAYVRGGLGAVSLDGTDRERIISAAEQAAEMAAAAMPDKDFVTLPGPMLGDEVPGLFDPAVAALDVPAIARIATECVEAARSIAPDATCTGAAGSGAGFSVLANSLGGSRISRSTSVSAWIEPIIRHGDDVGAFYDFDAARQLPDFDHRGIGVSAARTALKLLGSQKVESGVLPVVMGPLCANSFFDTIVAQAEAESHQRGRSWLCGKVGEQIASPLLTLTDDATIPAGLASRSWDTEGIPSRPLTVIEEGVLVSLLHNSYTANKARVPYTGHAHGGRIGPTNVNPRLGDMTAEDIIRDTKRGLYINMGNISPDSSTGEISAMVDFGFLIENGELSHPVSSTMLGMNGFDFLKNIDAVSSDARVEPGVLMPTVRVQGVRVAGGR